MAVNCRNIAALTFRYSYEAKGAFGIAEKSGRVAADVSPWLFYEVADVVDGRAYSPRKRSKESDQGDLKRTPPSRDERAKTRERRHTRKIAPSFLPSSRLIPTIVMPRNTIAQTPSELARNLPSPSKGKSSMIAFVMG